MKQLRSRRRLLTGGAALLAWPVLHAVLPQGLPAGVVRQGVVLGSLTGLTAVGLVLVYRACHIVNFAQATLGSAAAVLATQLFQARHWNYYVALTAGLAAAAAVGVLADRLVVQRFFWASRLVLTVGLAQVLAGVELTLPGLFGRGGPLGGLSGGFKTPLDVHFVVSPLVFSGAHVMVLLVVPLVLAALTLFLRYSPVGVAIRADSANAERAMLLGIPVRRLSTVVWVVAALLSALSAMLAAPLVGSGASVTGPALLLPALAAAVLARMESLPGALLAGVGVGVFEQTVFWNTSRASLVDVGLLGSVTLVYAIVAVSLVVLTGWAGQISLGQFAIAGVGATVTGDLVSKTGADLLVALLAGAATGTLVAVLVGLPALRVRGLFLGVTTLAFAVPLSSFALNPANFSQLTTGTGQVTKRRNILRESHRWSLLVIQGLFHRAPVGGQGWGSRVTLRVRVALTGWGRHFLVRPVAGGGR